MLPVADERVAAWHVRMAGVAFVHTPLWDVAEGFETGQSVAAVAIRFAVVAEDATAIVFLANTFLVVADQALASLLVRFTWLPLRDADLEHALASCLVAHCPGFAAGHLFVARTLGPDHRAPATLPCSAL